MGVLSDIMGGSIVDKIRDRGKSKRATGTVGPPSLAAHDDSGDEMASYKRGGKVRKTGPARLHKGEQVLTASQAKRYRGRKGKR